ncbi:MAG: hypothetical protein ABIF82_04050 [Planctomycetota bacterium]
MAQRGCSRDHRHGCLGESLAGARAVEEEFGVSVTIIIVCTTGASRSRVEEIRSHADIVRSRGRWRDQPLGGPVAAREVRSWAQPLCVCARGRDRVQSQNSDSP